MATASKITLVVVCAVVLSLLVSLQAGLLLLLLAAVGWWVWRYPVSGVSLFVVLAVMLPMLKITQTIGSVTLIKDVIILVLFVRQVLVPVFKKQLPYRRNILLWPSLGLIAWSAVETLRADSLVLGVVRAREIVLYLLLYWAVLYLPLPHKAWKEWLGWFWLTSVTVLILAGYQWVVAVDSAVLRFDPVANAWIPRLSGIMAHPSILGEYLILLVATLIGAGLAVKAWSHKIILAGAAGLATLVIFLTYSRAVWIGLIVAGLVMGIRLISLRFNFGSHRQRLWFAVGGLAVAIMMLGVLRFTPAGGLARSIFDPTYGSNEERLTFLARLIAPLTNMEALLGRGLGDVVEQNFREVDLTTTQVAAIDARAVQLTKNRTLVDNQYLKTFVEMGLVGLLLYAWLYVQTMMGAWRLASRAEPHVRGLGLAALGFLTAFIIQALFIDIWDIFPTNALFWLAAALVSKNRA
jgi:hypothetical protein